MAEHAGVAARVGAARAVHAVLGDGQSLDTGLAANTRDMTARDAAFAAMLAFGVLRHYRYLRTRLAPRLKRAPQPSLVALLAVGLFQLEFTRVPAHAAIHATVEATAALGLKRARGLVNAVLRGHLREPGPAPLADEPGEYYSVADWMMEAIRNDWPGDWADVLAASNERAPMWLRCNRRRLTPEVLCARLESQHIDAEPSGVAPDAVRLAKPLAAESLPGLAAGDLSIQDINAQRAADILAPADGDRVLDACAAPGNKTAHLLERAGIDMLALDIDATRLKSVRTNLSRLGLEAELACADATCADRPWWDGHCFDRILLDAPCSGSGVIRRHPDIKWLRREADIKTSADRQFALLDALWPTLARGGVLVYATCSILRAEGDGVIERFLAACDGARLAPSSIEHGTPTDCGRRLAPGEGGGDGFYYARLTRLR